MGNWNLGYTFLQSSPRHFRVSSCLVTRQLPFSPFHHFPVNSVSTSTPINLRSPKKREQTNAQIRRNNEVLQKNASSPIARTRRSFPVDHIDRLDASKRTRARNSLRGDGWSHLRSSLRVHRHDKFESPRA